MSCLDEGEKCQLNVMTSVISTMNPLKKRSATKQNMVTCSGNFENLVTALPEKNIHVYFIS